MHVTAPATFDADDYAAALAASNAGHRPLSLHLRLPLCPRHREPRATPSGMAPFEVDLARLDREMVLIRRCLAADRRTQSLHWSGSALPWMSLGQMNELVDRLATRFPFEGGRDRDFTVDLDPRATDVLTLRHLEALGFNRLGLGVRLLADTRQEALPRLQARIEPLLDETSRLGWHSLTLILDVTAPFIRHEVSTTLAALIAMAPPRFTLRPDAGLAEAERCELLDLAGARLIAAGYRALGRGAYARRGSALEDALAQAHREARRDRLGLGIGATSCLPDAEAHNTPSPLGYAAALDAGRLATASGHWRWAEGDARAGVKAKFS